MFYNEINESVKSHFNTPEWIWKARFGTWDEILMSRDKAFERAEMLAEKGFNAIVTFGSHFLWDQIEELDKVKKRVALLTEACHKSGIKVVEHKSNVFLGLKKSLELREKDIIFRGTSLNSMMQQSFNKYDVSLHDANVLLCFNNPDYQKLIVDIVIEFAELGIDGYMSDDVQFKNNWFTCVCPHCQNLYEKYSGYELPVEDDSFWANFNDMRWLKWMDFRRKSIAEHHVRLTNALEEKGFHIARMSCCSGTTASYKAQAPGGVYEAFRCGNNTVFQEVNINSMPFYSWESRIPESLAFNAVARKHHSPVISLYYNYDPDFFKFSWALSKFSGHRFWTTSRRLNVPDTFKTDCKICGELLNFEKTNENIFTAIESTAETAVFFSTRTRDLYRGQENDYYVSEWNGWCAALLGMNVQFDIITDDDLKNLDRYSLIVVPNAAMMYDETVKILEEYVTSGGRLIVTHHSSLYFGDGEKREDFALAELLGLSYINTISEANLYISVNDNLIMNQCGKVIPNFTPQCKTSIVCDNGELLAQITDCEATEKHPAAFMRNYGNGKVMYISAKLGTMNYTSQTCKPLSKINDFRIPYTRTSVAFPGISKFMKSLIKKIIPEECPFLGKFPKGLILKSYSDASRKKMIIHSLNVSGSYENRELAFYQNQSFSINYPQPEGNLEIHIDKIFPSSPVKAKLFLPFSGKCKNLEVKDNILTVSAQLIREYSVIEISIVTGSYDNSYF